MQGSRIVAVMLAAAMSACGGSSDVTTPSNGGQGSDPTPAGSATVTIQDFSYTPAAVTVKAGTTVRWVNKGPSAHTTVSDAGAWNSGVLTSPGGNDPYGGGSAGGTFSFTFTQAGTFTYHCSLHPPSAFPGFTGTVTVTP
jgi:plastocyanin